MNQQIRTATATVEVGAEPATVMALAADAGRIPQWAPGFADAVRVEDDGIFSATKDGRRFRLRVVTDLRAGTIDFLRTAASAGNGGAHLRATPRPGGGAVIAMTVPVPASGDVASAAATVGAELGALARMLPAEPR